MKKEDNINNMEETTNKSEKVTVLEKRRKMTSANYTMAMTALVLAFVIIINLVVSALSTDYRQIDLTRGSIFTLTEDSLEFLETLEEDVTIYHILTDITNRNDDLYRLLQVYADTSSHVRIQTINPAQNPTFMEDREYVSEGSIIVEYGDKFKAIELSDMLIASEDSTTGNTYYFYDMEGQITSALDYVTSDNIPKAYILRSASRDVFDDSLVGEIAKQNIDIEAINIIENDGIPEDARVIILDQPAEDITDKEYEMLTEYMDNGGSLLMFEYYNHNSDSELPNIENLLDHYGISANYGVALETNSSYIYNSTAYYSKPLVEEHEITKDIIENDSNLLVVMGDAIEIGDVPDSVTVEPLLTSTSNAYYKAASYKKGTASTSMGQLASDPVGTFNYAVAITDDISEELQSKFVYISSYAFAETDTFSEVVGSGNATFVVRCMQWLAGQEQTISIPMRSRTYNSLVYTLDARNRIMYTVVIIVPVVVLVYGGYVWFRRRRK